MKTLLIAVLIFSANSAWAFRFGDLTPAGSGSTGGGFVLVCPATPISDESYELLDFYEARRLYSFDLVNASGDLEQDYFRSVDRTYTLQGHPHLAEELREDINENLQNFFNIATFVDDPADLPFVNDVGNTDHIPSSCHLEQVALFIDDPQSLIILKPLWDKLSSLEQAALVQHEMFGHYYRGIGESTTEQARNLVAHIFATKPGLSNRDGIPVGTKSYLADGPSFSFYSVISNFHLIEAPAVNSLILQFENFFGRVALVKTTAMLPYFEWDLELNFTPSGNDIVCLLKTPGVSMQGKTTILGTMAQGYELGYEIVTGAPIKLALIKDGIVISTNEVTSCID